MLRVERGGKAPARSTGTKGEDIAEAHLRVLGYRIIGRNVRMEHHEIDIVAYDDEEHVLVFAEVKARSTLDEDFRPELSFTWEKRKKLRRAIQKWLARNRYEDGYQVDLIAVAGGRVVNHVEGVEL